MKEVPFNGLRMQFEVLEDKIGNRINKVLEHGNFIMGPEVFELEEKLAEFAGTKFCVTVASGTEALLMSLMALGVGPGDEVVTSAFSFISVVEVIALLGATPVMIDICEKTCNLNELALEEAITSKTKAIIPVSLYGQPSNMQYINDISLKHGGIPVIEDAAQSFGAYYGIARSCNTSLIGCTSFFPSKPLGCYGDGGAILSNDEGFVQTVKELRVHGQTQRYYHERVGVGGRMDTIQCAIVLAKLERFDFEVEKRMENGNYYNRMFDQLGVSRVLQRDECRSVFGQYTIFVKNRGSVQRKLADNGIPTSIHYPLPLNEQPAYKKYGAPYSLTNAKRASETVLSLPFSGDFPIDLQDYIIEMTAKYVS